MAKAQTYFAKSDNGANEPEGPTISPTPGPALVIHPIMALKAVVKSTPVIATKIVRKTMLKANAKIKINTELIILLSTFIFFIFTGIIRLGSVMFMIDFFKKANIVCQRNDFTPPDVEPEQPPVTAKTKKMV